MSRPRIGATVIAVLTGEACRVESITPEGAITAAFADRTRCVLSPSEFRAPETGTKAATDATIAAMPNTAPPACVHCGAPTGFRAAAVFGPGNEQCAACAAANGHGHAEDDASIDVTRAECPICPYIAGDFHAVAERTEVAR